MIKINAFFLGNLNKSSSKPLHCHKQTTYTFLETLALP